MFKEFRDPNSLIPDPDYRGRFCRGARVKIQVSPSLCWTGMVVKDHWRNGRRVIVDTGGSRFERYFDCSELKEYHG